MNKFLKLANKHLSEILSISSIAGIWLGDAALCKGIKDDDKKYIVLGLSLHGASTVCIGANWKNNKDNKLLLAAIAAEKGTQLLNYRQAVKEVVPEDEFNKIEDISADYDFDHLMQEADEADRVIPTACDDTKIFYFRQLHEIAICSDDLFNKAVLNLNDLFEKEQNASISDFLCYFGDQIVTSSNDPDTCDAFGWRAYDDHGNLYVTEIGVERYTKITESGKKVTYVYFDPEPLRYDEWPERFKEWDQQIEEETMNHDR